MRKDYFFIFLLFTFLFGVNVAAVFYSLNLLFYLITLAWVYCFIVFFNQLKYFQFLLLLIVFIIGFVRFSYTLLDFDHRKIENFVDIGNAYIQAKVINEPDLREDRQYLILETEALIFDDKSYSTAGKIKIKLARFPEYYFGETLIIEGELERPENFDDFNYADYLAKEGIFVIINNALIVERKSSDNAVDLLLNQIFIFKRHLLKLINQNFTEPEAGIVAGILLGYRKSIPDDLMENIGKVGLTHILAVSGFNITILINAFALILQGFNRNIRLIITLSGILFFTFLTGMSSSVIRASLMGLYFVIAGFLRREGNVMISLLLSSVIMIIFNPWYLNFDISFQLSVTATLGLIVIMPTWQNIRIWKFLIDTLLVTLAAQVFTLPIVVDAFGEFSLISPLANIMVLPLIPLMMLFSFLAVISAIIFWPLKYLLIAFTWLSVQLMVKIVEILAKFPNALLEVGKINLFVLMIYILLLLFLFINPNRCKT
ncbi:DUF4131 domain-containing protein [Candidatus Peregrinibacteria bacterium]|nr:DUF4131 domain-containing protein [Candidatus Peregrinibacteria bacterium]